MGNTKSAAYVAYSLITLVILVWIMYLVQGILIPLLFSILLSIALHPLVSLFERWGIPRVLSSILCVIIAMLVIVGLIWFIVYQVIEIGSGDFNLVEKVTRIWTVIEQFVTERLGLQATEMWNQVKESSIRLVTNATTYLSAFFGSAGNTIANSILIPLYMFFMLYYRIFFIEFFLDRKSVV